MDESLWKSKVTADEEFGNNPANPDWRPGMDPYHALIPFHTTDRPEVHNLIAAMRGVLDSYPERVLIGADRTSIADLARSMRDGYSTTGSSGTGLGAITRLASELTFTRFLAKAPLS